MFSQAYLGGWTNLFAWLMQHYPTKVTFGYCSDVATIRNTMAHEMSQEQGVDLVLWMDDDNILAPQQFEMLRQDLDDRPDLDAVVGWCYCQPDDFCVDTDAIISCGMVDQDNKSRYLFLDELINAPEDLVEIGYSGFPVVLMRYSLLAKAGKNPFTPILDDRYSWGKSGEDFAFWIHARDRAGARLAVDRRVQVPHFKRRAIEPRAMSNMTVPPSDYRIVERLGLPDDSNDPKAPPAPNSRIHLAPMESNGGSEMRDLVCSD
jgi:hypothetical protein